MVGGNNRGGSMKKMIVISILVLLALPAFSQEDEYAKFQGIWYAEMEDEIAYFIFENDTVIFTSAEIDVGGFSFCNFTLSDHKIIFYIKRMFGFFDSKWQSATPADEEFDGIAELDYVFSGNKLILIFDGGDPLSLIRMD
jgi:hypothetical protein